MNTPDIFVRLLNVSKFAADTQFTPDALLWGHPIFASIGLA
jgi:hypothetical protein